MHLAFTSLECRLTNFVSIIARRYGGGYGSGKSGKGSSSKSGKGGKYGHSGNYKDYDGPYRQLQQGEASAYEKSGRTGLRGRPSE